jgi:glycine cleavage system protein P-like pyridoxal-binding family
VPTQNPAKPPLSQRFKELMAEYGPYAVWTYFGIFAVVLVAFVLAIQLGFHTATTAGSASVCGAAYLATKLTQPLRIVATLVLTPFIAKFVRQNRRLQEEAPKPEGPTNATDIS